jgi:hypothetical protein
MKLPVKTIGAALVAASVALASPAEARWGRWGGWGWGGLGLGLAAGAIFGGAIAASAYPYYGYGYRSATMGMGTPPTTAIAIPPTEWHTPIPVGDMGTTRVAPTMATRMRLEWRMVGTIRVAPIVPTRSRLDGEEVSTGAGADSTRNPSLAPGCVALVVRAGKPWSAVLTATDQGSTYCPSDLQSLPSSSHRRAQSSQHLRQIRADQVAALVQVRGVRCFPYK